MQQCAAVTIGIGSCRHLREALARTANDQNWRPASGSADRTVAPALLCCHNLKVRDALRRLTYTA